MAVWVRTTTENRMVKERMNLDPISERCRVSMGTLLAIEAFREV